MFLLHAFLLIVTAAMEQENDKHESLVSDKKPTLEPFEGKSIALCVADSDQVMTNAIPIDSKATVMEEDDETTRLMNTQKNSSEGSYYPQWSN